MKTNKQWFETWFDSPYYHLLYQHRDETEAQAFIDQLLQFLAPAAGARILDLACGKGRHAKYIAEHTQQFQVTGIDLSPNSITYAQQFAHERLDFHIHDMRTLFKPKYFDYIFNFFTSFGYFDTLKDNEVTIKAIAAGLKTGGLVVIDFFNTKKIIANLVAQEEKVLDGVHFNIQREHKDGFIFKHIQINDSAKQIKLQFTERVQALCLQDLKQYLYNSGFTIQHIWGDYSLAPFEENTSKRLIILAKLAV